MASNYELHLGYHGGACCGIKTISRFWYPPKASILGIKARPSATEHDLRGVYHASSFFAEEAPKETYEKRFYRFVEYCDRKRPNGVIEAVIANCLMMHGGRQDESWRPVLEKAGFKLVNTCKNSNTFNTVYVYNRNSGEAPPIPKEWFEEEKEKVTKTADPFGR